MLCTRPEISTRARHRRLTALLCLALSPACSDTARSSRLPLPTQPSAAAPNVPTTSVEGLVFDRSSERPVAGAPVNVYDQRTGSLIGSSRTDLDGRYRAGLSRANGPAWIFAREGREIALATEEIFGVSECFADAPLHQAGGAGALRLDGRAVELVDVNLLWRAARELEAETA